MEDAYYKFLENKKLNDSDNSTRKKLLTELSSTMTKLTYPVASSLKKAYDIEKEFGNKMMKSQIVSLLIYACDDFDEALRVLKSAKENIIKSETEFNKR